MRVGFLFVPLCVSCISLPEATSGSVGCAPEEIDISNESSIYGTTTWTATCRGKRFFCTDQTSTVGGNTAYMIHDVKCTPEVEGWESSPASSPPKPTVKRTPPPTPKYSDAQLPTKAVGFKFGSTPEENRTLCQETNHNWSNDDHVYHCDGTPTEVGLPAVTRLGFCENQLCDLTAIVSLPAGNEGAESFMTLWKSLRKQYGKPGIERKKLPEECQPSERFVDCVASGEASWQAQWKWSSGERIIARTLSEGGDARLGVRYVFGEAERVNPTAPVEGVDGAAF